MKKNQIDNRNQPNDNKSKNQSLKDSTVSTGKEAADKTETSEETAIKPSTQRKPQFRLKENMRRRFN